MRVTHNLSPLRVTVALLMFILACGPLSQLQTLNQKGRALATGVAVVGQGDYAAFEAYQKLNQLPGYRLENRAIFRDSAGVRSVFTSLSEHDAQGNIHIVSLSPDGRQDETFLIAGQTYVFEPKYNGWVNVTGVSGQTGQPAGVNQISRSIQLLAQFGAVPTPAGQEPIQGRPATRYKLEYIAAELAQALSNRPATSPVKLQGTLWVDNQTGALLRSELLFYESDARQPSQEFFLEVSDIGAIAAIGPPAPIVNPEAVVAATATAQAWTVQQVNLNYKNTPVAFELIPLEAGQLSADPTPKAQVNIMLRRLPPDFNLNTDLEPFLKFLQQQLSLSIPRQNLVAPSNNFQLESADEQNDTAQAAYFFEVNLGDYNHVELIIANPGNPIFVAVPVATHP
jgi:hypothetical protein